MTDRHAAYIVVLNEDIREDDAEPIVAALRMVKGVLDVEPVVAGVETHIAEMKARTDLQNRMLDVLRGFLRGDADNRGDTA